MTPEQALENAQAKAVKSFEKHMDNIKRQGGLMPDAKLPDLQPDEKCPSCGGPMAEGVMTCSDIYFDDFGPSKVKCQECQGAKGHPAFKCRVCKKVCPADEIARTKLHFFMGSRLARG